MSRAKRLMVAVETRQPSAISSIFNAVTRMGLRIRYSAMRLYDAEPSASKAASTRPKGDSTKATLAEGAAETMASAGFLGIIMRSICEKVQAYTFFV